MTLLFQLVFLWPIVGTGYVSDDAVNAAFPGHLHNQGVSFWHAASEYVTGIWSSNGRFFPVSFYQGFGMFYLLQDITAYKLAQVVLTILSSVAVAVLLRSLGMSIVRTALVLLVATICFELRLGQDPLMAFSGLMQSVVIETALSLACLSAWLRRGSKAGLAGSFLLFLLCCLTYESAYVLSSLHLGVAILLRRPALMPALRRDRVALEQWLLALRDAGPMLLTSIVFILVASYGRAHAGAGSDGPWAVSYNAHAIVRTLGVQLFAGLPLSYDFKAPGDQPFLPHRALLTHMSLSALLIGVIAGLGGWLLMRRAMAARAAGEPDGPLTPVAGIAGGALAWFMAAAPIALAVRYQAELVWGLGHIPVFMEYYGIALVLVSLGAWVVRRLPSDGARVAALVLCAVFVGGTAAITYGANVKVADQTKPGREDRKLFAGALKAGILDGVPENANVLDAEIPDPWTMVDFYYMYSKRRIAVVPRSAAEWPVAHQHHPQPCGPSASQGAYWVSALSKAPDGPDYETVSCLGTPRPARDGQMPDRLYVRRAPDDKPFLILGAYLPENDHTKTFAVMSDALKPTRPGDGEWLMHLPTSTTALQPNTLSLVFDPDPGISYWGGDCSVAAGAPSGGCGQRGSVSFANGGDAPVTMRMTAALGPVGKTAHWTIGDKTFKVGTKKPLPVTVDVQIPAGAVTTLPVKGTGQNLPLNQISVTKAG